LDLLKMLASLIPFLWAVAVRSECFLPDMNPPFTVGLITSAPTKAPTASPTEAEAEIAYLEKWDVSVEEHATSYFNGRSDLDEWIDCYADSISFDFSDGVGSELSLEEYRILVNTFQSLINEYSIKHGSAEYIDDHTVEMTFVAGGTAEFGFMKGALSWVSDYVDSEEGDDGVIQMETEVKAQFTFDDDGNINQMAFVSPTYIRQVFGVLLSLYVTTSGPIEDSAGSLTLFGYNAFMVIFVGLMTVLTTVIGMCVLVSMRFCVIRKTTHYGKVHNDTDPEL